MYQTKKLKQVETSAAESFLLEAQIKNPERLKMLILSGSSLMRNDFMFIMNCLSLIKLDLSNNGLVRFPKEFSLAALTKLGFLHLNNNEFLNIEDLKPVFETTNLIHLTLQNNPLPMNSRIEHFILNVLKRLRVINDRVIF
jgi:Leucine-rich repeat (LRR) protein